MKETSFAGNFLNILKEQYSDLWELNVHGHEMQRSGVLDYVICIEGKLICIEFKIQRNNKIKMMPLQQKEFNDIKKSKGISLIIAYDEDKGEILIRKMPLKIQQEKYINIDWDFVYHDLHNAANVVKLMRGE